MVIGKHTEATKEKIRQALLGRKCAPLSKEHKEKIRQAHLGSKRTKSAKQNMSSAAKGKKKSKEHCDKISKTRKMLFKLNILNNSGSNSSQWKGGVTLLNKSIRNQPEYKEWRLNIYIRDNFSCQNCNIVGSGNLEAHHIKALSKIIIEKNILNIEDALECKELWDINNGITLCKPCHCIVDEKRNRFNEVQL